jgi:thiamine biosynthesis lipoprotein
MRFASSPRSLLGVVAVLLGAPVLQAETLSPVHRQHYSMGTMFDVVVYHSSRPAAERAIEQAIDEIDRLDRVMSHYKAESDLSRLNREGRAGFVAVEPSLYDVIQESVTFSRRSAGKFDVTIAPLLRMWKGAKERERRPPAAEVARARGCVGYEKIESQPPNRIRFASDCLEIDLGGIGKGYAVDRAMSVLASGGIERALINAGGSSIAAIGAPPGRTGWPVRLRASVSGREILMLRDGSLSTSEQSLLGEILDPQTGAPTESRMVVSVMAPRATVSDALSTTVLMLSIGDATSVLEEFAGVSAIWISPDGELRGAYRESQLPLSDSH